MSREPATHFHPTDTQAAIIELMGDYRERTVRDIAIQINVPALSVKSILGHMVKANALMSERLEGGAIYWLPKKKGAKQKAPRKAKAVELSDVAALNVATIERLVASGTAYEDAYAYLWNKQPKAGRLPEMYPKLDYSMAVQDRVLSLIEANPGSTAPNLRKLANMSKSAMASALQGLCTARCAHITRGSGHEVPNRYYPMRVAAE